MDPSEDQAAELEALEAIFMDDYKRTDGPTAARGARFSVSLVPEAAPDVQLRLDFEHPSAYPDAPLVVTALALAGLSAPRRRALQAAADEAAAEHAGMPSAFSIVEAIKEWVEEHVAEGGDGGASEEDGGVFETRDVTMAAKVEVIASKAIGTPVTVESFAVWRDAFVAELDAAKSAEERAREVDPKPTGRELFESKAAVVTGESESFWEQEADCFAGEQGTAAS
jgi:RWD domain/DRG Family Regulatory Proteins, Tma46